MNIERRKTDINARVLDITVNVCVEDNQAKVKLGFRNCCYGTIKAIKMIAKGYNSFSENIIVDGKDSFIILIQDLSVAPLEKVNDIVLTLPNNEIRKIDCTLYQISYEDGSIINAEDPNVIEYDIEWCLQMIGGEQEDEISEREQLLYIQRINKKAICYPKNTGHGWICVCGQLNKELKNKCISCGGIKEVLFDRCNKENVLIQCEEERKKRIEDKKKEEERKQQEEERRLAKQKENELLKQKKKKQRIVGSILAVICATLIIVLWRVNYVHTYGMDEATHQQWENALEDYYNWKEEVRNLYYGEGGFYEQIKNEDRVYTYSKIYSMTSLEAPRNAVLDKVGEIEEITSLFPKKYQEVFKKICEYKKLSYILDIDVTSSLIAENHLTNINRICLQLEKDISRLNDYLNDEYLNLDKVDLSTEVSMSYTPKTFSYTYSSEENYITDTMSTSEVANAKRAADEYCQSLLNKQPSISKITYTGTNAGYGNYSGFEYKLEYSNGTTKTGTVHVEKSGYSYKVTRIDLD